MQFFFCVFNVDIKLFTCFKQRTHFETHLFSSAVGLFVSHFGGLGNNGHPTTAYPKTQSLQQSTVYNLSIVEK